MRYSIITPTLVRPSLKRLCDSIDSQSCQDYEHLVVIDCAWSEEKQKILSSIPTNPRRRFIQFGVEHEKDFGNAARRHAFDLAEGEYILQIDDDDYYADSEVFETLKCVTKTWAVFPVLAFGKRCHRKPPAIGLTGSAMFMYRRDTGLKFPDNRDYSADGQLVEELKKLYEYQSLDDVRELAIYPQANHGREQHEIDAFVPSKTRIKYAADGLTIDWHDRYQRQHSGE